MLLALRAPSHPQSLVFLQQVTDGAPGNCGGPNSATALAPLPAVVSLTAVLAGTVPPEAAARKAVVADEKSAQTPAPQPKFGG